MVRVISGKLFSPPRSRHSSGELVDKELAARAVEALSSFNSRRIEFSDYESSSDSHWDSEVDFEGDGLENSASDAGTDVVRKRKERRRERNKLSAQAYRVRRREHSVKQQTVLVTLQEKNTRLKSQLSFLESELEKVRNVVRQRGLTPAAMTMATTTATTPANATSSSDLSAVGAEAPTGQLSDAFPTFRQPEKREIPSFQSPVDNDPSRRQQIAPVVDNYFSRPFQTPTNAAQTNACSTSFFNLPSPPPTQDAGHPAATSTPFSALLTNNSNCSFPVMNGKPSHPPQFFQHSELDANSNASMGNITTASVWSVSRNDDMNNNSQPLAARRYQGNGQRPVLLPPKMSFKLSKV